MKFSLLLASAFLLAAAPPSSQSEHSLDIINRVPKFTTFYADATKTPLDEEARWKLWKAEYGIAAVPPTPEGDALARKLLNGAWTRYPALMPKLPELTSSVSATANDAFDAINKLFETDGTQIHTKLVLYVGQFYDNAFSIPAMGGAPPTVVMPVEYTGARPAITHELAHTVNFQLAGVKNSFGGPLGETAFLEGLATRTTQRLVPGLPEASYVATPGEPDWLTRCYAHKKAVLRGILPLLDQTGPEIATRFTFGRGTTGMDREVYCAGWFVIGDLVAHGQTFAQLARVPENEMVQTVREEIESLLK